MKIRFPVLVALWVKIATAKESGNPKMRFKGPECIKLLENFNAFQDRYGNPKLLDLVPYLNFLKAYNKVRKTCYVKKVFDDEDLELCNDALKKFKIAAKVHRSLVGKSAQVRNTKTYPTLSYCRFYLLWVFL